MLRPQRLRTDHQRPPQQISSLHIVLLIKAEQAQVVEDRRRGGVLRPSTASEIANARTYSGSACPYKPCTRYNFARLFRIVAVAGCLFFEGLLGVVRDEAVMGWAGEAVGLVLIVDVA